ncbi:hypothetical protein GF351_02890 [Candidatus Woesearchaeota archaeon]|nr:hypothetical protein [Candidatus Woesearchaeota archaeon]
MVIRLRVIRILLLKCPKCKNNMRYQGRAVYVGDKRKRCVYCGHSFRISERVVKKL